jgi:hypothetical protein
MLSILSISISAQIDRDSLLFRGVIMESDSVFVLPYAKYNINNQKGYISNEKGQFSFWAKKGDVVKFSYVGFKPFYVQLHDSLANDQFLMGVFLSKDTIELSEVIIIPQNINPNAMARQAPMLTTPEEVVARQNIDLSAYQAKTKPMEEWDAAMNQKNFIQSQANEVAYQQQIPTDRVLGVSIQSVQQQIERNQLRKMKPPSIMYITRDEMEFLIATYHERIKMKLKSIVK